MVRTRVPGRHRETRKIKEPFGANLPVPPPAQSPIDNGADAQAVAQRILAWVHRLPAVYLQVSDAQRQLTWHGCLSESGWREGKFEIRGPMLITEIEPTEFFAVSYLSVDGASGICLFDNDGSTLSVWSPQAHAFDAWLATAVPDAIGDHGRPRQ